MLADMAAGIEAGRLLTYKAAAEIDAGRDNTMYASMAKASVMRNGVKMTVGKHADTCSSRVCLSLTWR